MSQTIKLKRSGTPDHVPSVLAEGELALGLGNSPVKVWVGKGGGVIEELFAPGGGGAAGPIPYAFTFPGPQWPGMTINIPVVIAMTVPANLAGSIYYNGANATAATNTFVVNRIQGGSTTQIGLVTVATDGTAAFSGTGGEFAVGDVLQMRYPSTTGDATLADVGITLLTERG